MKWKNERIKRKKEKDYINYPANLKKKMKQKKILSKV